MELIVEIQNDNTHTFALAHHPLMLLLLHDALLPQENLYRHVLNEKKIFLHQQDSLQHLVVFQLTLEEVLVFLLFEAS